MPRNPIAATITPTEARRAIYIDFESRKDSPPVLLGACYAEGRRQPDQRRMVLRHDVIDPAVGHLAGARMWTWPGVVYRYDTADRSLRASLADLVGRARQQDRLIVSWSQNELHVIAAAGLGRTLTSEFRARYRDAKATAKRWSRALHPEVDLRPAADHETAHQLAKYFKLTGFVVPDEYGVGRTGDNIKRVQKGCERGGFDDMTRRQQQAWIEVLGHNLYDCVGLRHVTFTTADELAALRSAA